MAIAAALGEARAALIGGWIRAIHEPLPSVYMLRVFARGNHRLLIAPRSAMIHMTRLDLPNPERPDTFVMLLRKHLRGGKIANIGQMGWDRIAYLDVERFDGEQWRTYRLIGELTGVRGQILILEGEQVVGMDRTDSRNRVGADYVPLPSQQKRNPTEISREAFEVLWASEEGSQAIRRGVEGLGPETIRDLVEAGHVSRERSDVSFEVVWRRWLHLLRCIEEPDPTWSATESRAAFYPLPPPAVPTATYGEALDHLWTQRDEKEPAATERTAVMNRIRHAIGKRTRTTEKLELWLSDADQADALRKQADLLMLYTSDLGRGTVSARIPDPLDGVEVDIRLSPALDAVENAQRLYEKAKRMKRGRPRVQKRLERIRHELSVLERALRDGAAGALEDCETASLLSSARRARRVEIPSAPRRFQIDGYTVLVGKSAHQNDQLLRRADPEDTWMHAKGVPGSHVIVQRRGRAEIPDHVLQEAAKIAGRYSKAERGRRITVSVTKVKHVRKPRGAPAGLAMIRNEDTLSVTVNVEEDE